MTKKNIDVWDTFAEAFPMKCSRIIITADNSRWAKEAGSAFTGFATSVIACGCEAGIERYLKSSETPDKRPGVSILIFSMSSKELAKQILNRSGQCIMTSPSSSLFAGNTGDIKIKLGNSLRYFGDGFQISKKVDEKRFWRIPVMDGEFVCEEKTARVPAIGGGNFLLLSKNRASCLAACEIAVNVMSKLDNVITPFPGGVVRSGSKVGSKYKACLLYTSPSPRDGLLSRMPSSA